MNARPATILFAAIASLVLHVAVVFALYDVPLGRIDPQLFEPTRVYRIHRLADDVIIDDTQPEESIPFDEEALAMDLSAMSLALLEMADPIEQDVLAPERQVQLREQVEERALEQPPLEMPVDLPDIVTAELIGPPPQDLAGGDDLIDTPGGTGGLGGGVAPGEGAARARELLADAGFMPSHDPLPPTRPHDIAFTPREQRVIESTPAPPPIDFAAIALENTTQLAIPEHLDHDFEYSITIHRDPRAREAPTNYFQIDIAARRSLTKLPTMPKDVIFLIDVSASVTHLWTQQIAQGVRDSLASLNPDDRFNIVLFNDKVAALGADGSLPATEANLAAARTFLDNAKSQGYTDVNRAMGRLLVRDVEVERVYNIVLISDGTPTRGVTDTRELINIITRDNNFAASIYCVGVGRPQNRELLDFLSYRNKGFSVYVNDHTQAAATIRDLLSRIRYPIMKDVRLSTIGLDSHEVYPVDLPNIHQGERFQIFGTFNRAEPFTMQVNGRNGHKPLDFTHTFELATAPRGDNTIATSWAFWKLHHLYSRIIQEGERKSIMDEIKELQRRYGLKTLY